MTGIILCGGKSSRMGSDKGLLSTSGITWAETACLKLAPFVSSLAISVNGEQTNSYKDYFPENQLIIDNTELNIGGPLCGLLSAHLLKPEEDLFLFACDLLFMESIVFEKLLVLKKEFPNNGAYVFVNEKEVEPLCGIYTANALKLILASYREGNLGKQSMKHVLEMINTYRTELPDEWQNYFKNINSRQELKN